MEYNKAEMSCSRKRLVFKFFFNISLSGFIVEK